MNPNPTRKMGRIMAILAAFTLLGLLWLFFEARLQDRHNPNRRLEVMPGSARELVVQRNRLGHYLIPGTINGQAVTFLLDTGATQVSIPLSLASHADLEPGAPSKVQTANGTITVYQTQVTILGMGPFLIRNVPANLNPGMEGDKVLLGMSVLKHLEFTQRGDTLVLRIPETPGA
jgi:aspartyl protease family protein